MQPRVAALAGIGLVSRFCHHDTEVANNIAQFPQQAAGDEPETSIVGNAATGDQLRRPRRDGG
jgi:hypothetical protein